MELGIVFQGLLI